MTKIIFRFSSIQLHSFACFFSFSTNKVSTINFSRKEDLQISYSLSSKPFNSISSSLSNLVKQFNNTMLDLVIEARKAAIAPGMNVRRILPFRLRRMVGPFIFMDHAGPVQASPSNGPSLDVLPHPHIGLSTVSYLFGGQVTHRDSLGVEQIIRPGEVNWMTAGSGIAHSERFEDPSTLAGGQLEMIQTWVALPEKDEEAAPSFTNYKPEQLPVYTDSGVWMRLIAGNAYGLRNDVKTLSPLFYLHAVLQQGTTFGLPTEHSERAVYVAKGSIEVNGQLYGEGQMLVFSKGVDPKISAKENAMRSAQ